MILKNVKEVDYSTFIREHLKRGDSTSNWHCEKGGCFLQRYLNKGILTTGAVKLKDAYSLEEKLWPT